MNKLYFVHIEKAAGTTLHEILRNNFTFYYIDTPYQFSKISDRQKYYLTQGEVCKLKKFIPNFSAFGGHGVRFYADYENCFTENIFGITFLRDPVERYLSHYLFQVKRMNIDWTFESFLAHEPFKDFMCKKICGEDSFEKSLQILENKKAFVGIVEHFDESILLLQEYIDKNSISDDFDIRYEVKNKNKSSQSDNLEEIKRKYREEILKNNSEDIKLYAHYSSLLTNEISSREFQAKLDEFKIQNNNYKFNKYKIFMMKVFKKLYIVPLEKKIRDTTKSDLSL